MTYKFLFTCALILICLLCLVAIIQTGTAIYFSKNTAKLEPADLVVVFPGGNKRIETGIEVVKDGLTTHFMVIGKTHEDLQKLLRKNGVSKTVNALSGGRCRSTAFDAYQAAKTIKKNRFRSVIVVTSSYHLPRSLFLLRVYLKISGQDVRIQGFPAKETQQSNKNIKQYSIEVFNIWGSIAEMAWYYFTDQ